MLSVNLVACLRIRVARKVAVVACFAPRTFVLAASLVRLIWLFPPSTPEYRLWLPAILTQVHVCVSIFTACIPYMVPLFKSLESGLRRTHLAKGSKLHVDGREGRRSDSLWFRRQSRQKALSWRDSAKLRYECVPQASPQIPTPRALSPWTPPYYHSRPGTANSKTPSARGLNISIPDRSRPLQQITDFTSPQTASSFALSPSCTSPVPLLPIHRSGRMKKAPTPPPKSHSPRPPTASSCYSSCDPSPISPARPTRLSLFPPQMPSECRYSPETRPDGFTPVALPPITAPRLQAINSKMPHVAVRSHNVDKLDASQQMRSASARRPPKFSTAPHPASPPSFRMSPTSKGRHASVQDLTSPMGTAINHYFKSEASDTSPPPPQAIDAPSSAKRQRNQQVLSSSNMLHAAMPPPTSPLPALPAESLVNGLYLPHGSKSIIRPSR
jgi:hypothetical protein